MEEYLAASELEYRCYIVFFSHVITKCKLPETYQQNKMQLPFRVTELVAIWNLQDK